MGNIIVTLYRTCGFKNQFRIGDAYSIKQSSKCCSVNCYNSRNSFLLIENNSNFSFNLILIQDLNEDNYCHYAIFNFFLCNTIKNYTILDEIVV